MSITPLVLGSGRSGMAIAKSFASLNLQQPDLKIAPAQYLPRGADLAKERAKYDHPILCIANPHGLHAQAILEADGADFDAILCEKPACVSLSEIESLRSVRTPTAILHVYRQMWGMQALRHMITQGRMGEVIAIEGRYWQASSAERALKPDDLNAKKSWKNDPKLSGEFDTYLDLATHFADAVTFLYGSLPNQLRAWRSTVNADAEHRDSHVHLIMDFDHGGRSIGSISKTVHGSTNHFEVNVLGSMASATWKFERPDEIFLGEGRDRRVITRKDTLLGSQQPPHHGMGWLEGYIEIASRLIHHVYRQETKNFPQLAENLSLLDCMLRADWERSIRAP